MALADGDLSSRAAMLPPPLAPRVCVAGSMQRPPFDGFWDGRPILGSLLSWIDIESSR
jgi:hypothetical protein